MSHPALSPSPHPAEPPLIARQLGHAGLIPFVAGALLVWMLYPYPAQHGFVTLALTAYAGTIVAFLGGVHWGLAMRADPQIGAIGVIHQPQRHSRRHIRICRALQDAHRKRQGQRRAQHQMAAAILDQPAGDRIALGGIIRRHGHHAIPHQRRALGVGKPGPHAVFREIWRRGDADKPPDPIRDRLGHQQRYPPPHRRPDQNLRPLGQRVDGRQRILGPITDGPVPKRPRRLPVPGIVKPQERPPPRLRPVLQEHRLGPRHVRHEPPQKHHPRPLPRRADMGDAAALRCGKVVGHQGAPSLRPSYQAAARIPTPRKGAVVQQRVTDPPPPHPSGS